MQKDGSRADEGDDFKPTPIPLDSWAGEQQSAASTLHEFIRTDAPPTVAALPAHYWEDALRHSVYLTLVRDKIDQLIAKGAVISPDSKPDNDVSKEVNDHDLWEKIKAAPFDRLREDPLPPGDVIILARGRLLEEKDGYRFAEDDAATAQCQKNNCSQPVKAYWSVKRVRQGELSQGKYHYELTFSVTSQATKKLKKPYENPVRTFTIRENTPTERPPPQTRHYGHHPERAQRAVWFHKNIAPNQIYQKRPASSHGLDRIFSSLFADDDSYDDAPYRRKPNSYTPHVHPQQHSKVGYVSDRDPYHQKKILPYPVKPQPFRYSRPPLPPLPVSYVQHPYLDIEQGGFNPHVPLSPEKVYMPQHPIRTTKPAVLPTPVPNYQILKESTVDVPVRTTLNATDYTTKAPDMSTTTYKVYTHKQSPMKVSYFPENIRPPVYNAPPGVFVTMDKKPFKPMPPLKLMHSSKPHKSVPFDFRPSPQIHDSSSDDSDSSADTAFRPITLNLTELLNSKKGPKNHRKPTPGKKPPKKHENIKPNRLTTVSPDIITAQDHSVEENDEMHWVEILGAFTKTTPMASHREQTLAEMDFVTTTTAVPTTTTETPEETTTTSTTTSTTTTSTASPRPRRTRPPPRFAKQEKIKKHKRVISTTTTTSTTTKPTRKYSAKISSDDLTPQASSAATSGANSVREVKHKGTSTTTSSSTTTTTTTSTTAVPITAHASTTATATRSTNPPTRTTTTVEPEPPVITTQPKSKNRFRQSTLMQKGTSVNHDKWSTSGLDKNRTANTQSKFPLRRKASKFQGYIPSSTPRLIETERNKEYHEDHGFSSNREPISTTTEDTIKDVKVKIQQAAKLAADDSDNKDTSVWYNNDDIEEIIEVEPEEQNENDIQESKDDKEYIFPATTKSTDDDLKLRTEDKQSTTEHTVVASPHSVEKNKTKCKKKKHDNLTTTENLKASSDGETTTIVTPTTSVSTTSTTTKSITSTPDILDELFGGFTMDDVSETSKVTETTAAPEPSESESAKHEQYIPIDDDIEDFLHSFNQKDNHADGDEKDEDDYDEEDDDEDSPFNNDDENSDSRHFNEYYDESSERREEERQDRPYSLLELMAME